MKKLLSNLKTKGLLFSAIAAVAIVFDAPPSLFWLYEPKKPAKLINKK